jgi:RHS repeat-associated protein
MTRKTAKIGGAITAYEYDAENKLVRVVSPANTVNYRYDGLGRRVEKEIIAGTTTLTKYVYDNEDILLELNGSTAIVARYTHGPGVDEPLVMDKNSQSFYYHADGLGSITDLTNQTGTVVQRYTYSSFGKIESQSDPNFVQPYTFTGRELDAETGLYHYRARYYDAIAGRMIQTDPIGFIAGLNLYVYSGNNPVNYIDPLGLDYVDAAANYTAGFGDIVSLGLTDYVRDKLGSNKAVDKCSFGYSAGWWTGMIHQLAFSGVGSFNGGAKTVLYSGKGALEEARAAKDAGRLLEDTLGGQLLNFVNENIAKVPQDVWKGASSIFAANAKGDVQTFLRNPEAGAIFNSIERPLAELINRVHSAISGSPAINMVPR